VLPPCVTVDAEDLLTRHAGAELVTELPPTLFG
jgi:hypothetical protein